MTRRILIPIILTALSICQASSQSTAAVRNVAAAQKHDLCSRFSPGTDLQDPPSVSSNNGVLRVSLRMQRSPDSNGHLRYCFLDERGNQAPTLRVQQGDTLIVTLKNEISVPAKPGLRKEFRNHSSRQQDPCTADNMVSFATNLHFHGLTIPPVCHQDETLRTTILPGDPPFEYRVQIPRDQPPGLYWYHPHVHGFTEEQVGWRLRSADR